MASDVGEASVLLGSIGWTLPYIGTVDRDYPKRLAERIIEWQSDPQRHSRRREEALDIHAIAFEPTKHARRLVRVLDEELAASTRLP